MADFVGGVAATAEPIVYFVGDATDATGAPKAYKRVAIDNGSVVEAQPVTGVVGTGLADGPGKPDFVNDAEFVALFDDMGQPDFYEDFHVIPRSFDFGNILSDQASSLEVFSAFRRETREWTSFTNGAGAGTELVGLPSLPTDVPPLESFAMTLEVSSVGEAFVDGTLDFVFDIGTISVPIEIQRIVLFGLEPELGYDEELESVTDIITSKDGTEKRQALRDSPRQSWDYRYIIQEGTERQLLENLMFDFQSRVFGVPVWSEDSALTVAGAIGDASVTVNSTEFRDYRVGGLAVVFTDQSTFDVLSIASFTTTTLTFDSLLVNSYAIGTRVYPLATCTAQPVLSGNRPPVGISNLGIRFENTDNDTDLDDTSAFSTFNSKVLLDNSNSVFASVAETFQREFVDIDSVSGLRNISSTWDNNKRGHIFTLRADGREAIFQLRGLLHALKGRFTSLYIPRSSDDLLVVDDLLGASNTMDVQNVGYAQFVRDRQPKDVIRLTQTDGTVLLRTVTSSENISTVLDRITVDVNWPSLITADEVERVEYVEKVRIDTDRVRIRYEPSGQRAYMVAPMKVVLE